VFVAFDLLYADGRPILAEPLVTRRERLAQLVAAIDHPRLVLSDGVAGRGVEYFAAATARGLEGIMAKRLASRYEPGARTGDWLKIKQKHELLCAIVGGVVADGDVRSLIIAAQLPAPGEADPGDPEGVPLRCVGRVGSGLTAATRARLHDLLATHRRETPFLPCKERGLWVEPGLYCKVSYLERTREGQLRAPVFLDLIVGA
jgi:ATP-dependent DNA ligase